MKRLAIVMALVVLGHAASSSAQNMLPNSRFDSGLGGWSGGGLGGGSWSPIDSQGQAGSGSALLSPTDESTSVYGAGLVSDCITVSPGQQFTLGGSFFTPAGQNTTGYSTLAAFWYTDSSCTHFAPPSVTIGQVSDLGAWVARQGTVVAPSGTASAQVGLMMLVQGTAPVHRMGYFDDVVFCLGGSCAGPPPSPPSTGQIVTPALPGFQFWGRIGGGRIGTPVSPCPAETVCIAGAIPSRAEVFVRIIGPKPNGYLWPNIVKFNTSETEIWIRQTSTGLTRYYSLAALPADSSTLPGLVDKNGFLP